MQSSLAPIACVSTIVGRTLLVISCCQTLLHMVVRGQPVPVRDEFQINSYTTGFQGEPALATEPGGRSLAVWYSGHVEEGAVIEGRLFAADGTPLSHELQVSTYGVGFQFQPAVAAGPAGDFVVVWLSSDPSNYTDPAAAERLRGQRLANDGSPLGGEFQIYTSTSIRYPTYPAVAVGSGGEFLVVWGSNSDGPDPDGSIQGQLFAADGARVGGDFQVNTHTTHGQLRPAVQAGPDGDFLVVWTSDTATEPFTFNEEIRAQRLAADGSLVGGELQVNTYTTGTQTAAALAAAPTGEFLVVWESGLDTGSFEIRGRFLTAVATPLGEDFVISSGSPPDATYPAVAASGEGEFVVAWQRYGQGPADYGIHARLVAAAGEGLSEEVRVDTVAGVPQSYPAVTTGSGGEILVVWQSGIVPVPGPDGSASSVQAREFVGRRRTLELHDGRFHVDVAWRDFRGAVGSGTVAVVPSSEPGRTALRSRDSAVVEFFGPSNWELLVKLLDGRAINEHFWAFFSAATDVGYRLTVTDTSCDQVRTYDNPLGVPARAVTDTEAFTGCVAPRPPACVAGDGILCLGDGGRFAAEITWRDFEGGSGNGRQVDLPRPGLARSDDSGLLYFFGERNWEMLVKVLDGCEVNDHFWVFSAATTDVEYTLTVTDTASGLASVYHNPLGNDAPAINDTRAFATCDL